MDIISSPAIIIGCFHRHQSECLLGHTWVKVCCQCLKSWCKKIIKLEFVEMRDLMPETWLLDEEESKKATLSLPRHWSAPVTDILQWLQCYAALVSVLSKAYPQMVPEFMLYQAMIIKCARDFHGLAWAQYDRAYRRQVAQTKDLRWSWLNPTLYSLCFAGKAKCHVICSLQVTITHPSNVQTTLKVWELCHGTARLGRCITQFLLTHRRLGEE